MTNQMFNINNRLYKNSLLFFLLFTFAFIKTTTGQQVSATIVLHKKLKNVLAENNAEINLAINTYHYDWHNVPNKKFNVNRLNDTIKCQKSEWNIATVISNPEENVFELNIRFTCINGELSEAAVSCELIFNNWNKENYVLLPAAAYNGNRYESRPQPYMPFFYNFEDLSAKPRILLSDIPRLNYDKGLSQIQERSGSMSTPSVGFKTTENKGFWLFTTQGTVFGDHGIGIEENRQRDVAHIRLTNPVVRELFQYNMTNTRYNTNDKPANFKTGDSVELNITLVFFDCLNVQQLFDVYNRRRSELSLASEPIHAMPYSEAFRVIHEKYNRDNYVEQFGYYAVGMQENAFQDWQTGWTGGMISTLPLLMEGDTRTRERVIRQFDWFFNNVISPGGLFWGIGQNGNEFFGEFEQTEPLGEDLLLVRKNGDAIYYIIKQFMLMNKMDISVKPMWKNKLKTVVDTLISVWDKNGQLGHYLNIHTNQIMVGGSTSGGIVPAALCLCAEFYKNPQYLEIAEEIADHYYQNYIRKGITYGGVGDAMLNFDSESSYGLLESFALLYEHTQNEKWLTIAEEMANQFATWVINYDYRFPENSLFGKLNMQTRGTVFANTQNKHLAPGICTYSGIALLRLFRATNNLFYINLLRDISRAIPQYLSHPQRPIPGMKNGWMSERVNSTDWWEPIGEIFCGSTWSETACMLTYTEIPSIYIIPDKQFIVVNDNVDAKIIKVNEKNIEIEVRNKTAFKASVKILIESSDDLNNPLGENCLLNCERIEVNGDETKMVKINL